MYGLLAIGGLSNISTANSLGWFNAVLSVSQGVGFSYGFVVLWLGAVLQVISLCISHLTKSTKGEFWMNELRQEKKFENEMGTRGYDDSPGFSGRLIGYDDFGGHMGANYGSAGFPAAAA